MPKIPLTSVLAEENTWGDEAIRELKCPQCGFNHQHVSMPRVIEGSDDYKAGWGGRGDLIVIPVRGECGHEWELCFGFHKGNTAAFVRLLD